MWTESTRLNEAIVQPVGCYLLESVLSDAPSSQSSPTGVMIANVGAVQPVV